MITAQLQGRRLTLTVETADDEPAIAPFVVAPLPARVGRELSMHYLLAVEGIDLEGADIGADLMRAFGPENVERAETELHQSEAEVVLWAAFMWQTIGGLKAAQAVLEVDEHGVQGGDSSRGKALAEFRLRAAPLLSEIRHRLESARRTLRDGSPDTGIRSGGGTSEPGSSTSHSAEQPSTPSESPASETPASDPSPLPSDSPPPSASA